MGEVTIRLRHNPATGKRELTIGYESEADLLPHEHEKDHRALAEKLLGRSLDGEVDEVKIERLKTGKVQGPQQGSEVPEAPGPVGVKHG